MGQIQYLNEFGDMTIRWKEEADERMLSIIQKQIDRGITFWEVEKRAFGLLPSKKTEIKSIHDIKDKRVLSLRDEDFERLFVEGLAGVADPSPQQDVSIAPSKRLKTARQVVKATSSIAMKPLAGG